MAHQTSVDTTNDMNEALGEKELTAVEIKEIKKKSVSGVLSFFVRTAILQGIGLLSALVLSAFLAPEDFGVYGIVTQIIALLIFFSDIGLAASLIQKKSKPSQKDYSTAFTMQLLLAALILGVAFFIAQFTSIHEKIGEHGVWVLLALAISFPLATFKTIPSIILERKLDFNKLVLPQIFEQLVFNSLLIVLAWKGFGVMSYSYAIIARSVVGLVVMQIIQPWKPKLMIDKISLKNLLGFGVKFQINDLLARIKDQLYFLVLGSYFPLKEFGYIQWAKNWSMYPYNLTVQNVMSITFPTFSRLQGHKDLLKKAIEKSIYFISALIFPILAGMSVFIYPLTIVFNDYQKWQPAVFSFVFFALSVAWSAISTPLTNTLNAIGKINQTLKLMVFWTILTWVLTPIMIWKFNFNGVALSAFIISFTSILSVIMVKKYVKIEVFKNVWAQLLATALMSIFAYLGMGHWVNGLKQLFIGMILAAMVYGFSFLFFSGKKLLLELKSLRKNL